MARIPVTGVLLVATCAWLVAAPPDGKAGAPAAAALKSATGGPALSGGNVPPGVDPETGIRSYSQHAFTKIRQGSMLRSELPDMPLQLPELRGELARRRDQEVIKHFSRLAELDFIAQLATDASDVFLAERSEEVRRKETQRFNSVMQDLRGQVWRKQVAETP